MLLYTKLQWCDYHHPANGYILQKLQNTDTSPIITLDDNDMTLGPPAGDIQEVVSYCLF